MTDANSNHRTPMRLRQVALVAEDLAAAEAELERNLRLALCHRDPDVAVFGLHNALYPIGDKLLEVVSPTQDGTTAGRLLEKRGGDGGYMVILQVGDLDALRANFEEQSARVVFTAKVEGVTGLHLHPRDVGGAILSVDCTDEWGEWPWAGPDWKSTVSADVASAITGVVIQADDPAAMAKRWSDVLARPASDNAIELDEGRIRFVEISDGRGEGVCEIELAGPRDASFEICGCRFTVSASTAAS